MRPLRAVLRGGLALALLLSCQGRVQGFGPPCTLHLEDGGPLQGRDLVAGRDYLALNAAECTDGVCIYRADAGIPAGGDLAIGYCSAACQTDSDCLHSEAKALPGSCSTFDSQPPFGVPAGAKYCAYPIAYPLRGVDAGG